MADHLHKQIRAALVAALTGLTTTGSRVYANRLYPLDDANLPGLRLYLDQEEAEPLTVHGPAMLERRLAAVVEGCAKASLNLDNTLDQIGKEVETALAGGITVAGRVLTPQYTGMSYSDEGAETPVGVKRMTFSVIYAAPANAPDTLS